jgi:DNA polymerase-3 subunit delta
VRLRADQLPGHLAKGLAPCYLLCGDEPLQMGEAADAVRRAARERGYDEREVFEAGPGFSWSNLLAEADNLSLFSDKRILDLRLASAKIGNEGSAALADYAARPPEGTVLLVSCPKLDRAQLSGRWVKALDRIGVLTQIWPVEGQRLSPWIEQRMRRTGLVPEPGVVQMLADRVEGNLLAAAQEIDKLALLNGPGAVSAEMLADTVADSARFDVFGLVDSALQGRGARCVRMIDGLRAEGTPEPVVLWALAREVRSLASMAFEIRAGSNPDQVMAAHRVWDRRKPVVRKGIERLSVARWQALLARCARADRIIKGQGQGEPWAALHSIALGMAGTDPGLADPD